MQSIAETGCKHSICGGCSYLFMSRGGRKSYLKLDLDRCSYLLFLTRKISGHTRLSSSHTQDTACVSPEILVDMFKCPDGTNSESGWLANSEGWRQLGVGGGSSAWKSTQPPFFCFGTILGIYLMISKQSIVENDMKLVDGGRCSIFLCWWRLNFVPQLDMSVPMA